MGGEWIEERNKFGGVRRYRIVNGVKEFETVFVVGDGIEVTQSEAEKLRQETAKAPPSEAKRKECPFAESGICSGEKCALYADGCSLARISGNCPTDDTKGRRCPFSKRTCQDRCTLYDGGCILNTFGQKRK